MKNLNKGLVFFSLIIVLFCLNQCSFLLDLTGKCPCNDPDCGLEELPEDANGNKYNPKELVLTFPMDADLVTDSIIITHSGDVKFQIDIDFIKQKISTAYQSLDNNNDPIPPDSIDVKTCICDENIFLIISNTIIGSETNVAEAANTQEEIRREGGIFSLNYIVENSNANENIPKGIVTDTPIPAPSDSFSLDASKPIVAILDSGIDFGKFSGEHGGIYLKAGSEMDVCGISDDDFGYNFIGPYSPNDSIQDLNGHGTIVSLAMKSRLETFEDVGWNSQRMLTVKVLDDCGNGTIFSTTCGLAYARKKEVNIINCSWGLNFNDIQLQRAISQIPDSIAIVCSAGNEGRPLNGTSVDSLHYPSGYGFDFLAYDLPLIATSTSAPTQPYLPNTTSQDSNVYEVLALDDILGYPCTITFPMNNNLADYSNKRHESFAEPANNVQLIIPENPCPLNQINGTSFAAPVLTAGLVHALLNPSPYPSAPPTRSEIINATTTTVGTNNPCFTRNICN